MAQTTYAAIDVGSNEVSMKIYEISPKKGIRELDMIRHTIELGADTYQIGKVSHPLVEELCNILKGCSEKLKEYDVSDYSAYATSAIREAQNKLLILDQIRLCANLNVEIISNSEQHFLTCKAISLHEMFSKSMSLDGTLIAYVGAGSIQLSIYDRGTLFLSKNIKLGSLRIRELLSNLEHRTNNYTQLISEYIDNDLQTFRDLYLSSFKIKNLIGIGEHLTEYIRNSYECFCSRSQIDFGSNIKKFSYTDKITQEEFHAYYDQLLQESEDKISYTLGISKEQASLILPTAMIYDKLLYATHADSMWLPGITLCDGMAVDYAEKQNALPLNHSFQEDILAQARTLATRYHCNKLHSSHVECLALQLFDALKKLHGLNKRDRLLLRLSVILHNCGEYISMTNIPEHTAHIIQSSEIIGLTHKERKMIAYIVRYKDTLLPPDIKELFGSDKAMYLTFCKLTAIHQIANALDKSHRQKFNTITVVTKDSKLIILTDSIYDISLEQDQVSKKAQFFEEVYGLRPILNRKRSI